MLSRARLRRVAGNLLSGLFELAWSLCFAARGRLAGSNALAWQSPGRQRVLVVAPHPDDETLACGGTILRHRAAGDRVVVVTATDGRASRAGRLPPAEMAARRRAEAHEAMRRLDAELHWLGLPERDWKESNLIDGLATVLRDLQPDVVYAPSPIDHHPEHVRVARALAASLDGRLPTLVRIYELSVPLGSGLTSLISDIAACESRRRWALAAYSTQSMGIMGLRRLRRYAGLRHGQSVAEPFWEVEPHTYRAVVAAADWPERESPFRGIRPRAWSDPLAYLFGRQERRRLAHVARRCRA